MAAAYESLRVLGRGSYGTALLVREQGSGSSLRVLKEVDLSRMPPAARREASKEVDVLKSLHHNNIIAYSATFIEFDRLSIVMEYADGGSVADAVARRRSEALRFGEVEALSIFSQSCLAMQHIHAKRILHRDLKSQNIFLMQDGTVKLGDFGISKVLEHTQAEAITVIGTPSYLAPEVCDSQPYGTKADVWSLGVVFYEVLTLELPFQARSLAALIVKIVSSKPRLISVGIVGEDTRRLVKCLLRKKPEKRISIDEVLAMPLISRMTAVMSAKDVTSDAEVSTRASTRNNSVASIDSTSTRESAKLDQEEEVGEPSHSVVPMLDEEQIRNGFGRRGRRSLSRQRAREVKGQISGSKQSVTRPVNQSGCGAHKLDRSSVEVSFADHDGVDEHIQGVTADNCPEEERTLVPWDLDNNADAIHPGACCRGQGSCHDVYSGIIRTLASEAGLPQEKLEPLPQVPVTLERMPQGPCQEHDAEARSPWAGRTRPCGHKVILPRLPAHARRRRCCLPVPAAREPGRRSASPPVSALNFGAGVSEARRQGSRPPWRLSYGPQPHREEASPLPGRHSPPQETPGRVLSCHGGRPASTPALRPLLKRRSRRPVSLGLAGGAVTRLSTRPATVDPEHVAQML